jgi:hypothetical protein
MQLKRTFDHRDRKYNISDAVECICDGSDYDRGSLETAAATAQQTSEFLAKLVAKLHETGALEDEDILALLPGFEVV